MANDTGGSLDFKVVAAVSYSGANLLQWPHLKNSFKLLQEKDVPADQST